MCRAVFASRFSTIRSTLAPSAGTITGWMSVRSRASGIRSDSASDAPDDRADVGREQVRRHDAPGEPVEVEEVRDEPVELAGVAGDPPREVLRVVLLEVDVAALQRDREPEDRRQRRPEVVRDGLQERVLHLVERAQAPRRLALDLERAGELLLGLLALGDVEQEALPERGAPLELHEQRRCPGPRRCGRPC